MMMAADPITIAVLTGAAIGVLVAGPTGAVITWLVMRDRMPEKATFPTREIATGQILHVGAQTFYLVNPVAVGRAVQMVQDDTNAT